MLSGKHATRTDYVPDWRLAGAIMREVVVYLRELRFDLLVNIVVGKRRGLLFPSPCPSVSLSHFSIKLFGNGGATGNFFDRLAAPSSRGDASDPARSYLIATPQRYAMFDARALGEKKRKEIISNDTRVSYDSPESTP